MMLSVIIPTFTEAHLINRTIDAVAAMSGRVEVIVVDGGSLDETVQVVRRLGVKTIASERGRGAQMHAGACIARGDVLWFLHADASPSPDAADRIVEALREQEVVAGYFSVLFDGAQRSARFLTWLYPHLRKLGLCYGDSAIFVRTATYHEVEGFRPFPIFEDLDLVRRLRKKGHVVHLPATITTSSRRFEGRNFAFTFAQWATLQVLYWLGVHPRTLGQLYAPIRSANDESRSGGGKTPYDSG